MILTLAKLASRCRPLSVPIRSFSQQAAAIPQSIPEKAVVTLPRSLVAVHGFDSAKFLNGLLTIRPPEPSSNSTGDGAYAALLNAKGRIIADLFVFPAHDNKSIQAAANTHGESCFLLDVDTSLVDKILNILDFHILLSDVKISLLDSFNVHALWNDEAEMDTSVWPKELVWTEDKRAPGLGYRVVSDAPMNEVFPTFSAGSVEEYRLRRYLFGVPEGPTELKPGKALPLDSCIDYMGGIDFGKGCYQGQELTIRTHHHGAVRKRVMPVVFTKSAEEEISENIYEPVDFEVERGAVIRDESPIPNAEMVNPIFGSSPFGASKSGGRQRPAGRVIAALGNVGLAKIRIDTLGHDFRLDAAHVKPMTPFWWPAAEEQ